MSWLAAIRPDDWNLPLFVHVLGAMILVGGLLASAAATAYARGEERFLRLGFWTLLTVALPGWIVMRAGAEWIYGKQGWDAVGADEEPAWLGIGWITADAGAVLLLAALVTGGFGVARLGVGKGSRLLKTSLALSLVLLALYVVAAWAMSAKPG
jgi:hypothetical protein